MRRIIRMVFGLCLVFVLVTPSWAIQNSTITTATPPTWKEGDAAPLSGDLQGVLRADPRSATAAGHSHTSAATITLTPTAGLYVYITGLDISNCEGATTVAVANPTYITTTNLTGSPQYQVGSGPGTSPGVCSPASEFAFAAPLKAAAVTTAVTFVLPTFITNQTVSVNVYWFSAP
jgi:hypothetical protein